jgi:acyl carrier protein
MAPQSPDAQEIRRIVREVIRDALRKKKSRFQLEDVKEGVSLTRDLSIDSLDILQMTAVCEQRFGIKLPDSENASLDELGSIVQTIAKHLPRQ